VTLPRFASLAPASRSRFENWIKAAAASARNLISQSARTRESDPDELSNTRGFSFSGSSSQRELRRFPREGGGDGGRDQSRGSRAASRRGPRDFLAFIGADKLRRFALTNADPVDAEALAMARLLSLSLSLSLCESESAAPEWTSAAPSAHPRIPLAAFRSSGPEKGPTHVCMLIAAKRRNDRSA